MKCPYCGEENLVDAKFCSECGKPISGEIPAFMYRQDDGLWSKLTEVRETIENAITTKNYKEILNDTRDPATNLLITFLAWLMLRMIGIRPFLIIVRILSFTMGYSGLVFLLATTYVYTKYQKEIKEKVEEIKDLNYKKTLKEIMDSTIKKLEPEQWPEAPTLTPAQTEKPAQEEESRQIRKDMEG